MLIHSARPMRGPWWTKSAYTRPSPLSEQRWFPRNRRAQPITPLRRDRGATDHPAFVGEPISFARSLGPSHPEAAGSVRYRARGCCFCYGRSV